MKQPEIEAASCRSARLALLFLVPAPSLGTAMAMWLMPGTAGVLVYAICKVWICVLPLVWTLRIDHGRLSWSRAPRGGLVAGLVLGLVMAAMIWGGYEMFGKRWINAEQLRQAAVKNGYASLDIFLTCAAYLILVNSLLEEYVWRWFVYRKCEVLLPRSAAVLTSAVFFTLHHGIALRAQAGWIITIFGCAGVLAAGTAWSWCYKRYRSIWPGYLSHVVADLAILAIGWRLLF
jgi:membrane protease YdiL (CAAX protease family)